MPRATLYLANSKDTQWMSGIDVRPFLDKMSSCHKCSDAENKRMELLFAVVSRFGSEVTLARQRAVCGDDGVTCHLGFTDATQTLSLLSMDLHASMERCIRSYESLVKQALDSAAPGQLYMNVVDSLVGDTPLCEFFTRFSDKVNPDKRTLMERMNKNHYRCNVRAKCGECGVFRALLIVVQPPVFPSPSKVREFATHTLDQPTVSRLNKSLHAPTCSTKDLEGYIDKIFDTVHPYFSISCYEMIKHLKGRYLTNRAEWLTHGHDICTLWYLLHHAGEVSFVQPRKSLDIVRFLYMNSTIMIHLSIVAWARAMLSQEDLLLPFEAKTKSASVKTMRPSRKKNSPIPGGKTNKMKDHYSEIIGDHHAPKSGSCCICYVNKDVVALRPCGHNVLCKQCLETSIGFLLALKKAGTSTIRCPLCAQLCII